MKISEEVFSVDEAIDLVSRAHNMFFINCFITGNFYSISFNREENKVEILENCGCITRYVDKEFVKDKLFSCHANTNKILREDRTQLDSVLSSLSLHCEFMSMNGFEDTKIIEKSKDGQIVDSYELRDDQKIYVFKDTIGGM